MLTKVPGQVNVFETHDPYVAQILKLKLENEGIPVALFDQRDSSYNAFGYLYLSVPQQYEEEARKLIEQDA